MLFGLAGDRIGPRSTFWVSRARDLDRGTAREVEIQTPEFSHAAAVMALGRPTSVARALGNKAAGRSLRAAGLRRETLFAPDRDRRAITGIDLGDTCVGSGYASAL